MQGRGGEEERNTSLFGLIASHTQTNTQSLSLSLSLSVPDASLNVEMDGIIASGLVGGKGKGGKGKGRRKRAVQHTCALRLLCLSLLDQSDKNVKGEREREREREDSPGTQFRYGALSCGDCRFGWLILSCWADVI